MVTVPPDYAPDAERCPSPARQPDRRVTTRSTQRTQNTWQKEKSPRSEQGLRTITGVLFSRAPAGGTTIGMLAGAAPPPIRRLALPTRRHRHR